MSEPQPIETAPKDGTPILVWVPCDKRWIEARWEVTDWPKDGDGEWASRWAEIGSYGASAVDPSHWLPVPPHPLASPPQPDALKLAEASMVEIAEWLVGWSPDFLQDADWPATKKRFQEALAAIRAARERAAE